MNWFEAIEQKRKLLVSGIIIICLAILAVTARRNNLSFDSFWHIQMGIDWLQHGLSPWVDHYSFTFNGNPIISPTYIFDGILAVLVSVFDLETGLELFQLASFISVFLLVSIFLRKLNSPVLIYLLVLPLLMVLLQLRAIVRPELISYSLSVIAIMLYYRAQHSMSFSNMLPIALLLLFWNNYHSPIFGYIIFFGYFIDLAITQFKTKAPADIWVRWMAWGLVMILVGFLTPNFKHPLLALLNFSPDWVYIIQEYQPPTLYSGVIAIYSLIIITIVTILLLVNKRHYGLLIVSILLVFFAIKIARLVTPTGIVTLCIFAWMLSEYQIKDKLFALPKKTLNFIGALATIVFIISLYSAIHFARGYMLENRHSKYIFANDVVEYMQINHISGRIFNDYSQGGFLIYSLSPESQIYIDGRTAILYPIDHYYRYSDVMASSKLLVKELAKYNIDFALLPNSPHSFLITQETGVLGLDYIGSKYSLYKRNNPNLPLTGRILASPSCLNMKMHTGLLSEQELANKILDQQSIINTLFYPLVNGYSNSDNQQKYLKSYPVNLNTPDIIRRFIAYQALQHNMNNLALNMFLRIKLKSFPDFLAITFTLIQQENWQKAEQWLDMGIRNTTTDEKYELTILYNLLQQIRAQNGLHLFTEKYLRQIGNATGNLDINQKVQPAEVYDFCITPHNN